MKKERQPIENLLEFLNRYSTEPGLVWNVSHLYDKEEILVQWIYDKTTKLNWYFKLKSEETWTTSDISGLMNFLIAQKADLSQFELEVLKIICIQAVCAHYYIEKAGELIGKDKIDLSIEALKEVLGRKAESDATQQSAKKVPRLKLINKKKKKKSIDD
jgi:hypothetical protein